MLGKNSRFYTVVVRFFLDSKGFSRMFREIEEPCKLVLGSGVLPCNNNESLPVIFNGHDEKVIRGGQPGNFCFLEIQSEFTACRMVLSCIIPCQSAFFPYILLHVILEIEKRSFDILFFSSKNFFKASYSIEFMLV